MPDLAELTFSGETITYGSAVGDTPIGVGGVSASFGAPFTIAFAGSSSPNEYLTEYTDEAPDSRVTVTTNGIDFATLGAGRFGMVAGKRIAEATNRLVRFIRGGVNGTTLAGWEAANSGDRAALVARINSAGGCNALLLQVGWNDANTGNVNNLATQLQLIRSLIARLRSETSQPNLIVFIGQSQDTPSQDSGVTIQRRAELEIATGDVNVRFGFATYDLPTRDNIHQTTAAQATSGARFAAQIIAMIAGTSQSRGPRITAATRVSDTMTDIVVTPGSGSDFTPTSAIAGFRLSVGASPLAISAATRTGTMGVRLTHDSTGGAEFVVRYHPNAGVSDDANILRGNDPLALPAEMNLPGITVAAAPAPAPAPSPTPPPASSQLNDTFTSPDGTALGARTADSGHNWSILSGAFRIHGGAVYGEVIGNAASSWVPETATYSVGGRAVIRTIVNQNLLLLGRLQSNASYYWAGLSISDNGNSRRFILGRTVNGGVVEIANKVVGTVISAGAELDLLLTIGASGSITLSVNGSVELSGSDTTAELSAKGSAGIRSSVGNVTASTGMHLTSIATA